MLNRIPVKTIRCKWYDDDRNPVSGGCKNESSCDYAHPSEPQWGLASRRQTATERPPRRGGERPGTPPALRSRRAELSKRNEPSGNFDRRDERRKASSDFDESTWQISTSKGKAPERTHTWGGSSSSARRNSRPEKSASFEAGSSKGDGKKDDSSWASASGWAASSGWGNDSGRGSSSGWGLAESSGTKEPKGSDGRGSGDNSWGAQSKDTGGWGSGWAAGWGSPQAGGSGSGAGGWGQSSGQANSPQWGPSSPSTSMASSAQDNSKADLGSKKPGVALQPTKKPSVTFSFGHSRQSSLDSQPTPDPRKVSFAVPALPLKTPAESKGKERAIERPPDLTIDTQFATRSRHAQPSSAGGSSHDPRRAGTSVSNPNTPSMGPPPLSAASSSRAIIPGPPSSATSTTSMSRELLTAAKSIKRRAATDDMKPKISILHANLTPEERAVVYQKTIRYMQELVCLQIKLNQAKAKEQCWKRNQASPHYSNSSQLAREKLTTGREEAVRRAQELRKQRDAIIKELIALPDIPTKPYRPFNVTADRQKLVDYTLELKKWMEDLDLPRRVAALQIKEVQTPKPANDVAQASTSAAESLVDGRPDAMAVDVNSDAGAELSIVDELRAKPRITVADLNEAIERLQHSVGKAWEQVAFEAYTQEELDQAVDDIGEKVAERLKARNLKVARAQRLKLQAAMDGQKEARNALTKALEDKLILGEVVNERIDKLQAMISDLKQKTAEINKLNDELEIQIVAAEQQQRERTDLVNTLSNEIRALGARKARAAPRKVRQYTIDDFPLEFRQKIVDDLVAELQPVLQGFLAGTSQAGEELKAALEQMIEPLLQKTAVITKAVKSMPTPPS